MYSFPIGVILHSLRKSVPEALDIVKSLGAQGIQVYGASGAVSPCMPDQKRREFLAEVKARGLTISAVCGDLGHGFGESGMNAKLLSDTKRILDFALELGTNIVTTHIGVVPSDTSHPRFRIMRDACGELARYADDAGAKFAIETGPEPADVLKVFLDSLHSTGVSVNLDPANLVMVPADDPVRAVYTLKDYIVHTHAKDGRQLFFRDPEVIYGVARLEPNEAVSESFIEVPLGEGQVDFPAWIKALDDIGYRGFLTIEREVGPSPVEDITRAVKFLKGILNGERA